MQLDSVLAGAAQSGVAITLLLASLAKARKAGAFRRALGAYHLLPDALVTPTAFAIIAAEALGAVALLFPISRSAGAAVSSALLVAFAAALAINIVRGHTEIDCGCFAFGATGATTDASAHGRATPSIGWWHVARALLLATLAATAFAQRVERAITPLDYLTLYAAVLLIVCTLLTLDALLANLPRLDHLRNS